MSVHRLSGKEIYHFCFVLLNLYSRGNSKYKPHRGAYIRRGDLTEGFLRYDFGGLIHGGAYFLNFTVTKWNPINGLGMADTMTTKTKRFT